MNVGGSRVGERVLRGIKGAIKRAQGDRIPRASEFSPCYGNKNFCAYCRHVIRMRRRGRGKGRRIEHFPVQ